jgi:hypothetical protein
MPKVKTLSYERMVAALGVIVCCGVLVLAVPRFIASLYAFYPEAVLKQTQKTLSPEVYEKSIANLNHALAWYQNPEYWQARALLYLHLLSSSALQPLDGRRKLFLTEAQTSIIHGLKLSPVEPYAWFRLAAVDKILNLPSEKIINALRLSFYAGRVEPELLMSRLAFGFDYYNEFNEEMQLLWRKQLAVAWAFQAAKLVEFVAQHPDSKPLVEEAFANSPDDWKKFSFDLENFTQKNP